MPSLHEIQATMTTLWLDPSARAWLLRGARGPVPDILTDAPPEILASFDRDGAKLYGGLLRFGHHDVMEAVYPFCCRLLARKWQRVVDDYLDKFPPAHHNLNRLCHRFPQYLSIYRQDLLMQRPYLAELADYEWIELEKLEQDIDIVQYPHADLATPEQVLSLKPVANPTLTLRKYNFNICELVGKLEGGKRIAKLKEAETFVAVFRHPQSHRAKFIELGIASAKIVEGASEGLSYRDLIPLAVSAMSVPPEQAVLRFLELVEKLQDFGVFIGSQPVVPDPAD